MEGKYEMRPEEGDELLPLHTQMQTQGSVDLETYIRTFVDERDTLNPFRNNE